MQHTVSVIIPTYNRSHTIAQAIQSVQEQSIEPLEIIVIDDGSTDNTSALIKETFPDVKLYRQSNHGVSHARNRGIESASGNWIAFLDSDDAWYPGKLEAQLKELERNPKVRLCHSDEHWIRNGRRVNQRLRHEKRGGHKDQLSRKFMAMDRFRLIALEKILLADVLNEPDTQATVSTMREKFQVYSAGAMKRGRTAEVASLRARYSRWLSRYTD